MCDCGSSRIESHFFYFSVSVVQLGHEQLGRVDTTHTTHWPSSRLSALAVSCHHRRICYASAQRSVAGDILFISCSSVRPCVRPCVRAPGCSSRNIVNTIYLADIWHIFTKLTSTMHYGTEINPSQFGVKTSKKVKVMVKMPETALFWSC